MLKRNEHISPGSVHHRVLDRHGHDSFAAHGEWHYLQEYLYKSKQYIIMIHDAGFLAVQGAQRTGTQAVSTSHGK